MTDVAGWAQYLLAAEASRTAVAPVSDAEPELTVAQAYEIQRELIRRRVERGEAVVGVKLGLTSKAKQDAMGIAEPVYGVLTDAMTLGPDEPVDLDQLIHPRVEPELAFILAEDLHGPGVTAHDVLDATAAVCVAIEVIDSRYAGFRFTLPDVIADNTSAARYVLGDLRVPPAIDLAELACRFEVDGRLVATATGAAVLGHPAEAVALAANRAALHGERLRAQWTVLSGGLTNAAPLSSGQQAAVSIDRLGRLTVRAARGHRSNGATVG